MKVEKYVSKYGDVFVICEYQEGMPDNENVTDVYTRRQGFDALIHQFGLLLPFDEVADIAVHLIDSGYYTWENMWIEDYPFVSEEDIEKEGAF